MKTQTGTEGGAPVDTEKRAFCKPWREVAEETNLADALILDFSLQNCEKKIHVCFQAIKSVVCCYDNLRRLVQLIYIIRILPFYNVTVS